MLGLNAAAVIGIIVIALFVVFFFLSWGQIERGRRFNLRPLQSLNHLRRMVQETVETGKEVHFSPGAGGLNGQNGTGETLSGLTALSSLQKVSARSKGKLTVTTNDALTNLLAQDIAESEYEEAGRFSDYRPDTTVLITQQENIAYIAGATATSSQESVSGTSIIGQVGPEYLLLGDTANRRNLQQVSGSTNVQALPVIIASAGFDNSLLGEEVYAAPAYLSRQPALLASLRAQDIVRWVVIALIILGVVAATLELSVGDLFIR